MEKNYQSGLCKMDEVPYLQDVDKGSSRGGGNKVPFLGEEYPVLIWESIGVEVPNRITDHDAPFL